MVDCVSKLISVFQFSTHTRTHTHTHTHSHSHSHTHSHTHTQSPSYNPSTPQDFDSSKLTSPGYKGHSQPLQLPKQEPPSNPSSSTLTPTIDKPAVSLTMLLARFTCIVSVFISCSDYRSSHHLVDVHQLRPLISLRPHLEQLATQLHLNNRPKDSN